MLLVFGLLVCPVLQGAAEIKEKTYPKYSAIEYETHTFSENPFGLHVSGMRENPEMILESGVKWLRFQSYWQHVEPTPGARNWKYTDGNVRGTQKLGCVPIIRLQPKNSWGFGDSLYNAEKKVQERGTAWKNGQYLAYPTEMDAFLKYVHDMVERYDGDGIDDMPGLIEPINLWELINEYDCRWISGTDKLKQFYKEMRKTILAANPNAKIMPGGLTTLTPWAMADGYAMQDDYWVYHGSKSIPGKVLAKIKRFKDGGPIDPAWLERPTSSLENFWGNKRNLVESMLDVGPEGFDHVDFHIYGEWYAIPGNALWIRDQMDKRGYRLPIMTGEMGITYWGHGEAYTEQYQAEQIIKVHTVCLASGMVRMIYSSMRPHGESWGELFGNSALLEYKTLRIKAAYHTYCLMVNKLKNIQSIRRLPMREEWDTTTRVYEVERPEGRLYIAWSDHLAGRDLLLETKAKSTVITRVDGSTEPGRMEVQKWRNNLRGVRLQLTDEPIFIEFTDTPNSKDKSDDVMPDFN